MFWLLSLMGLLVITAVAWAQDERPDEAELRPIGADGSAVPFTIDGGGPTCSEATLLSVPGGDSTDVSNGGISANDPTLACMWGTPQRPQGYRTVWYKFTAPHNGRATLSTRNSKYDTVLAVYNGTCDNLPTTLSSLACNDDAHGFSSEVSLNVIKGRSYYVEVADWHQAVEDARLNISLVFEDLESNWQEEDLMPEALSRHTAVTVNNSIYILGGQDDNVFIGSPSNSLWRFDATNESWHQLAPMPGETGYAHAAAVYYEGKIYMPGGVVNAFFDGSNRLNQDIDGRHWVYTIGSNFWSTAASPAWPGGAPWSWSATVASADTRKLGYYLIGGLSSAIPLDTNATAHSEMLFYSTFSHDWHEEPSMAVNGTEVPRYGHTAAWLPGKGVCVTGGVGSTAQLLSQGMCFNVDSESWSSIAAMREPRYGATSAVGPDGRWYVFGGIGQAGYLASTEVYNPRNNTWNTLNVTYDLGGSATLPARAWLQVKWAHNNFWAFGGETGLSPSSAPVPLVERLYIPPESIFMPFGLWASVGNNNDQDNFRQARGLALNNSQTGNFEDLLDFVDIFYFDLPNVRPVRVRLTNIPGNSNFDIAIYNNNKLLWGKGENLFGQDEDVRLTLAPGRYYVLVKRVFPTGPPDPDDFYKIKVEG